VYGLGRATCCFPRFLTGQPYWVPVRDLRGPSAELGGADLTYADLTDADLTAANLGTARGLSVRQLIKAHITHDTKLPEKLADDPQVKDRADECEAAGAEESPE
ncbi:pentapeptide repeat-containing protein, partial [Streptomyces sp. NPDC057623]|uniref:pentapeptide repeat-containing protein n=1 Tax=Streptomyces sp. NPDC057623 TaxID=3346187 RepID=UPI0036AA95E3